MRVVEELRGIREREEACLKARDRLIARARDWSESKSESGDGCGR